MYREEGSMLMVSRGGVKLKWLRVTYKIITPMFLRGARSERTEQKNQPINQSLQENAELRLPSIKGVLRSWYRVFMPEYYKSANNARNLTYEEDLFGGTRSGAGQSRFIMRITKNNLKIKQHTKDSKELKKVKYLSFFLENDFYFEPEQTFSFELIMRPYKKEGGENEELKYWKQIIPCLWLLGQAGSLGARGNRGFGVVSLKNWETNSNKIREYMNQLSPLQNIGMVEDWLEQFGAGIKKISDWFPGSPLLEWATIYTPPESFTHWNEALENGADLIKDFRKNHKDTRIALGLPINAEDKFTPERMPSPVNLKVIKLDKQYFPVFFIESKPFPSVVRIKRGNKDEISFSVEEGIKDFKSFLLGKRYREVKWDE